MKQEILKWIESTVNIKVFNRDGYPEVIYIIESGFENKYILVFEDGYEYRTGETEILTKEEILTKYKIKL